VKVTVGVGKLKQSIIAPDTMEILFASWKGAEYGIKFYDSKPPKVLPLF
jgi:hypothetical protein